MKIRTGPLLCWAVLLAGCASPNPPLMFGDHASFGLHLGNDNAAGGAAFALGYRHLSVAVVPVSALTREGVAAKVVAHDDRTGGDGQTDAVSDALSVFAVFEGGVAGVPPADPVARVGQVFSTGLAAQMLTRGYDCRARGDAVCQRSVPQPSPTGAGQPRAPAAVASTASATRGAAASGGAAAAALPSERPYQRPLVFMRNDVYGIDLEGSLAGQGAHFTLGYTSRNTALIPVVLRGADGQPTRLLADGTGTGWRDAFSVVGQFRADSQTTRAGVDLGRYFATGLAAQNLGSSIQAGVARGAAAQPATAQPRPPQGADSVAAQAAAQ